ncbi:TetR/AcrR family transcriptional regulator [Tateyamaria sp.]|uniref:TetR/AcrR family transcriptional regulator n=1 Tax=Tateyamaria sp. TaxID=1929288 RepID=UPI0032A0CB11
MAKALGVSRGSFYWHFPSLGDFHDALLATWRAENTLDVISQLEQLSGAQAKISALIQMGIDTPQPLENGMRRWGGVNNGAADALADVDQIRTSYLTQLLIDSGLPRQIARDRAVLLTWAAIGRAFAPALVAQTSTTTCDDLSKVFVHSIPEE